MIRTEYKTARLYLKILKPGSAKYVLDYYSRNADFLREWDPDRDNWFYTLDCQKKILRNDYIEFKMGSLVKFWIINPITSTVIGNICFSNIIMGNFKSAYMSYKLDENEINKGYITEAISKAVEVMFHEFGLHRIEVNVMPKNVRSLRVMEKLGFIKEGFSQKYLKINGVWEDHIHFAAYNVDAEN